ncbi:MAG: ester cyclase, partial [Thermoplasmata archaeon]|nr:ester cyclase [Thermoplasmata archaeon]
LDHLDARLAVGGGVAGYDAWEDATAGLPGDPYLTAIPDMQVTKERSFGQDDWICVEVSLTGTHTGPMSAPGGGVIPATHKTVRSRECYLYRFDGGEIAEQHLYADVMGYMAQLGLLPGNE